MIGLPVFSILLFTHSQCANLSRCASYNLCISVCLSRCSGDSILQMTCTTAENLSVRLNASHAGVPFLPRAPGDCRMSDLNQSRMLKQSVPMTSSRVV